MYSDWINVLLNETVSNRRYNFFFIGYTRMLYNTVSFHSNRDLYPSRLSIDDPNPNPNPNPYIPLKTKSPINFTLIDGFLISIVVVIIVIWSTFRWSLSRKNGRVTATFICNEKIWRLDLMKNRRKKNKNICLWSYCMILYIYTYMPCDLRMKIKRKMFREDNTENIFSNNSNIVFSLYTLCTLQQSPYW